jgi:hypothetical protein
MQAKNSKPLANANNPFGYSKLGATQEISRHCVAVEFETLENMPNPRRTVYLEPISKSLKEDDEAGELHEAKEVLRIKLPADKNAALPLNPGEEPFDQPAHGISAKSATILGGALAAIGSVRR